MKDTSPTVRQRELGTRLRQLRTNLGLTVEGVANELLCSPAKINRMEAGERRPSLRDVRDFCRVYGVDEQTSADLIDLARDARQQGWWVQYDDLKLGPYIGLEHEAASITTYTMYYVPALLQTEAYARAIIKAIAPKISPEVHQQRVEARLRRQQVLDRSNPPRYHVLLGEAVLCHRVGGLEVMAAQLDKVLEYGQTGKARVQLIPFDFGSHATQDSNFVVFEFDELRAPVVFVEGLVKHQYQEGEVDVARYHEAVEHLSEAALSPNDSVQRIAELRNAYMAK